MQLLHWSVVRGVQSIKPGTGAAVTPGVLCSQLGSEPSKILGLDRAMCILYGFFSSPYCHALQAHKPTAEAIPILCSASFHPSLTLRSSVQETGSSSCLIL